MKKVISIVVSVYRNEGSLIPTYSKVVGVLERVSVKYDYEFVFVNDGSDDGSLSELRELASSNPRVKVVSFSKNFGQVSACIAGHKIANGDAMVYISADLQDPPELILDMIKRWEEGNEVVICHRINREDGLTSILASKVFYYLMKIVNNKMPIGGFDFWLLDRIATDEFVKIDERNRFVQSDILWLGFNTAFVPYTRLKRTIGKSQWTFFKKFKYFVDGIINTSYMPIRFMSMLGLFTATSGFLYALVIIYLRLVQKTPFNGYAPIMISILIIGGLIMLMLGTIGEYLWRIFDEVRGRSIYVIKETLNVIKEEDSSQL
jgi:glycosyltransferase involved in cell wall biosynthesis